MTKKIRIMQYLYGVIRFKDGVDRLWLTLSQGYCMEESQKNQTYAIPSCGILQVIWHATYKTMDSFLQWSYYVEICI
jgi:hypothetical protein